MFEKITSSSVNYKTTELLSESPNSWVYRAFRCDSEGILSQPVVLKILKSKKLDHIWKREFESLLQVQAEHCVRVLGFERLMGFPSLILEPIEGIDSERLLSCSYLTGEMLLSLVVQVYHGLQELSAFGLFHGDLSPTNVLISNAGRIKLIDYGRANGRVGQQVFTTRAFASPEIIQGEVPCFQSDLFSLGKLIELWLTAVPFEDILRSEFVQLAARLSDSTPEHRSLELKGSFADQGKILRGQEQLAHSAEQGLVLQRLKGQRTESLVLSTQPLSRGVDKARTSSIFAQFQKWQFRLLHRLSVALSLLIGRQKMSLRAAVLLFSLSFFLSGAERKLPIQSSQMGQVTIRTHQWFEIATPNGEVWSTPQTFILPPGRHSLIWQSRYKKGETVLTVESGEHILFTDQSKTRVAGDKGDMGRVFYLGDLSGAD